MARVFVTGSTEGLGRAAAEALLADGHRVVVHARNQERAAALDDLVERGAALVTGDLGSRARTLDVAEQVNALGRMDAVIHNAGVYETADRAETEDGHTLTFAVNVLAPYLLTAAIEVPDRLVYLSSNLHRGGRPSLDDLDWTSRDWDASQAYNDSKLLVAALALAVARRWPHVLSHAVDPGWVPTRMGGPGAPDDLALGHVTQTWLAVSDEAGARTSGGYWFHQERRTPEPAVTDEDFQNRLVDALAELTGLELP